MLGYLLLQKVLAPILKTLKSPPDNVDEYKAEYGYLGSIIHSAVVRARTSSTSTPTSRTTLSVSQVRHLSDYSIFLMKYKLFSIVFPEVLSLRKY